MSRLFGCVLNSFAVGEGLIDWVTGHRERAVAEAAGTCWLLAHCDDGVVWGRYENDRWHLSSTPFPNISPAMERQNVQQLRVFGENHEVLIWRTEHGFRGRVLRDSDDSDVNRDLQPKQESQILVGDRLLDGPCAGFSLVGDAAGTRHAVPLHCQESYFDPPSRWPLRLSVTHYLTQDDDSGTVRVGASRLVDVCIKEKCPLL